MSYHSVELTPPAWLIALRKIIDHKLTLIITLFAITPILMLPVLFQVASESLENYLTNNTQMLKMTVFLHPQSNPQATLEWVDQINQLKEVKHAQLYDEKALQQTLGHLPELKQVEKTLGQSLFLNWVEIEFNELTLHNIQSVRQSLDSSELVESLHFNQKWLNEWHDFIGNFQVLIRIVSVLLLLSAALILANQTRLFIETQRRELYIKRLLGATQQQLQSAFIFIGLWYGALGGALALLALHISLLYLNQAMTLPFELFFSLSDSGIMVLICTLIGGVSASVATHLYTLGLSHESI